MPSNLPLLKPTQKKAGETTDKTQEQQLAIQIIDALREWISLGSRENYSEDNLRRRFCEIAPKEYHPDHFLDYRLGVGNKLWMDSIVLKLKAKGKDGLSDEIKQRQKKFLEGLDSSDKKLKPSDITHLPNRQLVYLAARLANALEQALPYLGTQPAEEPREQEDSAKPVASETEQNTAPAKHRWVRIWNWVKSIPRWIYILVPFLAALLTILHLLGRL